MKCPHCQKLIDDKLVSKHLGSKGGKADKKGKRPDLQKGGSTWEKRWGKAKKV
jgi:hypothetical protein